MRLSIPILLALLPALACDSADVTTRLDAGYAALNSADGESALEHFEAAYEAMENAPEGQLHLRALLGLVEATALARPESVEGTWLTLHHHHPELLEPRDYIHLASSLLETEASRHAATVMDLGVKRFPDDPELAELEARLARIVARGDDPELAGDLDKLGYLGGD